MGCGCKSFGQYVGDKRTLEEMNSDIAKDKDACETTDACETAKGCGPAGTDGAAKHDYRTKSLQMLLPSLNRIRRR